MSNTVITATPLEQRVTSVLRAVAEAATKADRDAASVTVVAVSKTVGRDAIDAAYAAGIRHFGENRVQDAVTKFIDPLPGDAMLHMIGQLQTNKAGVAAKLFDIIESVDRPSLIKELEKQAEKQRRILPVLLQVNIASEEQKAGCEPVDSCNLAALIAASPHLRLQGLMTIAPLVADPEDVRPVFRGLRELRNELVDKLGGPELPMLSMGMSNDFRVAIEEGATHVRVGRAIFSGLSAA